jgi:cytochrome P450
MGWIWPLTEPWKDKIADDMKAITAFIAPIIDNALRQEDERKRADQMTSRAFGSAASAHDKVEEEETLLSHLVKTSRDRKLLQDETLNMLVAGRDTVCASRLDTQRFSFRFQTASTLTWAIYILAMYPNIRDRLREEVLNDVGPNREPTFDDIRNMKYLRAFVNGACRPAIPPSTTN